MPASIISEGRLSNLQLEAIVYGCQRHQEDLPMKMKFEYDSDEEMVETPIRAGAYLIN